MGTCLLFAVILLLQTRLTEALRDSELCYVLDAILFLYGLILTILYCQLKFLVHRASRQTPSKEKEEAVYTGLSGEGSSTYETLQMKES